ncbi:MAG: YigZ family protein [Peptococcaceae bacterium]|jgi:uncharacterized YigZ family protein|nr:YigZ family protein [Peptococcaceae bacterium]
MADAYKTIYQESRDEFVVSRSRFIGRAKPIVAEEDALSFIETIRKSDWDASHHVWAYISGAARERYSDDGEPQGTAGLPILDVIRKEGLRDTVVIVTRYFGGIKLGTGGLVRAYTQSAKLALEAGRVIQKLPFLSFGICIPYALAGKFQREFQNRGYYIQNLAYTDQVTLTVLIPPEDKDSLHALVAELTSGSGTLVANPEEYLSFWQGKRIE